jgi:broad specificity phosphatase PhoE
MSDATPISPEATVSGAEPTPTTTEAGAAPKTPPRKVTLYLVRHGQTQFNVEQRLPGQLAGVALTEEGKRQATQLGDAIRAMPLTAIVTSPLERARDTATIVGQHHDVTMREDPRLMDTDVGHWSGQVIGDVDKSDPAWGRFVRHPTQPPPGIEGFYHVLGRVVAAAEAARHDEMLGDAIMLVAHADVIKLIIAHYLQLPIEGIHWLHIDNASITVLAFTGEHGPSLRALNWVPTPAWLQPEPAPATTTAAASATEKSEG